jgi:cytochrome c oxidase subunit 2
MHHWLPFWPRTASVTALPVNALFIAELAICGLILTLVVGLLVVFTVRYREGSAASRAFPIAKGWHWEIGWTAASLAGFLLLFVWGASLYIWLYRSPPGDIEIYVVGKQWMWKFQHPGGQREINALHVPVEKSIRLVLASQDVIHSFYVPAFRIKHDVVPGTMETIWFRATKTGRYLLECSEFCGDQHALMKGWIDVMQPAAFSRWLTDENAGQTLAQAGETLFRQYGCSGCHGANSTVHAPSLAGVYGSIVQLQDGSAIRADERYIEDCILKPRTFTVAGYPPIMPSFAGEIGDDELMKLVAYIQSLSSRSARDVDSRG